MQNRYVRRALVMSMVGFLIACGSSVAPGAPDVNGSWMLSMSNLTATGINCTESGMTLNLSSTGGGNFTGTYSGGTYVCTTSTETDTLQIGSGPVTDGGVAGNLVAFDLGTSDSPFSGQFSAGSMSGTASIQIGQQTLNGNWQANRPTQ